MKIISQSFDYTSMTLEEAYYLNENGTPPKDLICDGDNKKIFTYIMYDFYHQKT